MNNWSVIRTRPRWEKKVARLLLQKGIETYCPLQKTKHQWSDRVKTIEMPLLKSYVFVKVAEDQRTTVRLTDGVVNFVYQSGKPVVLKEKLIQSIRQFQLVHSAVEVSEAPLQPTNGGGGTTQQGEKNNPVTLWIESLRLLLTARSAQPNFIEATTDKI